MSERNEKFILKASGWVSRQTERTNKVFNQLFDKNRKLIVKVLPETEAKRSNDKM